MTDADLIYNALLRTESRLEAEIRKPENMRAYDYLMAAFIAVVTLREELGTGLDKEGR